MDKTWLDKLIEASSNTKGVDTHKLSGLIEDVEQILFLQETLKKSGIEFEVKLVQKRGRKKVVEPKEEEKTTTTTKKTVDKKETAKASTTTKKPTTRRRTTRKTA